MMFPGIRNSLSSGAGSVIEPFLFGTLGLEQYFVPTVFILGSSIMIVNTVIRSFFMDPLKQAHHSHRSKQISQQMREARLSRDTAKIDNETHKISEDVNLCPICMSENEKGVSICQVCGYSFK